MRAERCVLTPFDRVVLAYGVRWRPQGFIDATRLLVWVPEHGPPRDVVGESLMRLTDLGLVMVTARGARLRYKRTPDGLALALELLHDMRVSFGKAIRSRPSTS